MDDGSDLIKTNVKENAILGGEREVLLQVTNVDGKTYKYSKKNQERGKYSC